MIVPPMILAEPILRTITRIHVSVLPPIDRGQSAFANKSFFERRNMDEGCARIRKPMGRGALFGSNKFIPWSWIYRAHFNSPPETER